MALELLVMEVAPPEGLELVPTGALYHDHQERDWLEDDGKGKGMDRLHVDHHPRYRTYIERNKSNEQVDEGATSEAETPQERKDESGEEDGSDGEPRALSVELGGDGGECEHEWVLEEVDHKVLFDSPMTYCTKGQPLLRPQQPTDQYDPSQ